MDEQDVNSQFAQFNDKLSLPYVRSPVILLDPLYAKCVISSTIQILNREIRLDRSPHIKRICGNVGCDGMSFESAGINAKQVLCFSFTVEDDKQLKNICQHMLQELKTYFAAEYQYDSESVKIGEICYVRIECA